MTHEKEAIREDTPEEILDKAERGEISLEDAIAVLNNLNYAEEKAVKRAVNILQNVLKEISITWGDCFQEYENGLNDVFEKVCLGLVDSNRAIAFIDMKLNEVIEVTKINNYYHKPLDDVPRIKLARHLIALAEDTIRKIEKVESEGAYKSVSFLEVWINIGQVIKDGNGYVTAGSPQDFCFWLNTQLAKNIPPPETTAKILANNISIETWKRYYRDADITKKTLRG
jgi:hypothetical protein